MKIKEKIVLVLVIFLITLSTSLFSNHGTNIFDFSWKTICSSNEPNHDFCNLNYSPPHGWPFSFFSFGCSVSCSNGTYVNLLAFLVDLLTVLFIYLILKFLINKIKNPNNNKV